MSRIWQCDRCHKVIEDYQSNKNHILIYNKHTTEPVLFQYEGSVPMEDMDLCDKCMEDYVMMMKLFVEQSLRYDPRIGTLVINN